MMNDLADLTLDQLMVRAEGVHQSADVDPHTALAEVRRIFAEIRDRMENGVYDGASE